MLHLQIPFSSHACFFACPFEKGESVNFIMAHPSRFETLKGTKGDTRLSASTGKWQSYLLLPFYPPPCITMSDHDRLEMLTENLLKFSRISAFLHLVTERPRI